MRKYLQLILTLLVCNNALLTAQVIPFQNFTIKNGLPNNIIYDIEQDKSGYLWFATQVGAVRFDGYNFISYSTENGLPDNNIIDIFADSKNRIWFATVTGGLALLENKKIKIYNRENGLVSDYSKKVFEDHENNIWYASSEGISILHSDTILNYDAKNSLVTSEIECHYVAMDGTVWVSTKNSLLYYRDGFHVYKNKLLDNSLVCEISEDRQGSYWLATIGKGIFHVTGNKTVQFLKENGLSGNNTFTVSCQLKDTVIVGCSFPNGLYKITDEKIVQRWESEFSNYHIQQILVDKQERIWISTPENGVLLLENNKLSHISEVNNLCNNQVYKLFEDFNGNIWIATNNGVSKYGKVIFQIFNNGFLDNKINVQSIASYGNQIYAGTYSGLNIISGNRVVNGNSKNPEKLFREYILSILPVNDEETWFGTDVGLSLQSKQNVRNYPFTLSFDKVSKPGWITDIKLDGQVLYCATDKGLVKFENNKYQILETDILVEEQSTWGIEIDRKHNIWCATVNGLSIFDGKSFHYYDTLNGLPHRYCNDLAFDLKGFAWIATDKGLSRVKLNDDWSISCLNIDKSKGLKSDIVFSVLVDKEGFIWAGHNYGLDRIDPNTFSITHYGALEGFLPIETSLGAATNTAGSDLWFGTVGGAVRYIRDNDFIHKDPPLVYVNEIKFFDDSSSIYEHATGVDSITGLPVDLSLPYNKNNLIFSYVGIHYTIIEKNQYKFMLEGYDNAWSAPTYSIETPPYRKIPPGSYTFKILAANCDGTWTDNPVEFSFTIRPPFYKTWWFIIIEIFTGIALLLTTMWIRVRKLQHDKRVLTQKVKERTVEIEKQRDQIALQKKEITDSIVYAERIQSAVLPTREFTESLLNDYFILFKPRDIVSGDFYWLNKADNKVIVVAADCTGHGVPGAFMSMLGVTILNEIANNKTFSQAGKILDILREHLTKTLGQTDIDSDSKDGMDLALCIIDFENLKLQYSGAYNPLIHIRSRELTIYKGDKMPVGIHLGIMPPFTTHEILLQKGDCIYIHSDGYVDQFGGPEEKKFKSSQFHEVLTNISDLPMSIQKDRLNETIMEWMGINEQIDDILVVGIRI
jgi:ligand-binding sensor domain-containing protein/serine phosphatase RsbU (regulator of sigma subunit)